ncbi:glycosyltransferase family 4 protein [Sphingomonas radiodurans]|uniref:glycosyltransferase family 4 protein n=1 Tax=Sphingomonas radiodurans TaxID=2890321 RepID=UPI001E429263|nr:glycosyltransferase family 4 protein [Sphingomonas radiodurans]WBH18084.1 glycosyltransferase family 4 protein [Sphingomonas radiodurans]
MRILHVSSVYPPHVVGGAERIVEMLAEAQVARGHSVGAAYLTRHAEPAGERHGVAVLPQASRNLIWMEDVFASPRVLRTANKVAQMANYRAAADIAGAIATFRPDIVHTHSMVELPPMIWAAVARAGARSVHTLHDYDLLCSRASLFRNGSVCDTQHAACRVAAAWKARFAGQIDAVAAVSQPVLDVHRRFGLFRDLPDDHARVIWNAVDVPAGHMPPRRDGDFVFGFLGRLVPEKGIETLLAACRSLPTTGWRLRIAGRAQEGDDRYRALAEGLPVEFVGFTDPRAFLDTVDVLAVPSVWLEPFGLTVVEAFARGVPVLGSRLGAIADLVGTVGDEWLVTAGDPAAWAARMIEVMQAGRAALPRPPAFDAVLGAVTPTRMLDAYDTLYADVLRRARAA